MSPTRSRIAHRCTRIEKLLPKAGNFIRVYDIAEALHGEIYPTPLFVEATIASNNEPGDFSGKDWVVLIDSERFAVTIEDIHLESPKRPLSVRLRNSIAHELAHILGFKGESAKTGTIHELRSGESQKRLVKRIEKDIEAVSPLLLIPEAAVKSLMESGSFSLPVLVDLLNQCQVSREVLIGRLNLAEELNRKDWHNANGLNKTTLGIGVWENSREATICQWPTFSNPSIGGLIPEFVHHKRSRAPLSFADLIENSSAYPLGGDNLECDISLNVGTAKNPAVSTIPFRFECENVERQSRKKFLFSVTVKD